MNNVVHDVAELVATHMLHQQQFGPAPSGGPEMWHASFTLTGRKSFDIHVSCDSALATAAARRFFAPDAALTDNELRDAVGEVGNVIAGNLKAVITGDFGAPSTLSTPRVVKGGPAGTTAQFFACESGTLAVRIDDHEG